MGIPIILIIFIVLFIALLAGVIYLQMRLSRSENKYVGLVLPIIFFILSLIIIFSYVGYYETETVVDGVVTRHHFITGMEVGDYFTLIFSFLIANIPTAILMAIYFGERSRMNTKKALEKMKIEDL